MRPILDSYWPTLAQELDDHHRMRYFHFHLMRLIRFHHTGQCLVLVWGEGEMGGGVVGKKTAHPPLVVSQIFLIQPGKPVLKWNAVCVS